MFEEAAQVVAHLVTEPAIPACISVKARRENFNKAPKFPVR